MSTLPADVAAAFETIHESVMKRLVAASGDEGVTTASDSTRLDAALIARDLTVIVAPYLSAPPTESDDGTVGDG